MSQGHTGKKRARGLSVSTCALLLRIFSAQTRGKPRKIVPSVYITVLALQITLACNNTHAVDAAGKGLCTNTWTTRLLAAFFVAAAGEKWISRWIIKQRRAAFVVANLSVCGCISNYLGKKMQFCCMGGILYILKEREEVGRSNILNTCLILRNI